MSHASTIRRLCRVVAVLPLAFLFAHAHASPSVAAEAAADPVRRRVVSEQNGSVAVRDGGRVRVTLEMGDVHVRTQATGAVKYRLRVEAPISVWPDSQPVAAPRFRFSGFATGDGASIVGRAVSGRSAEHVWVTLEVDVPRNTPLEVNTQGGSVDVSDIDGRLICETAGGTIHVGRVGATARLQTAGGDVIVQDVNGDLTAITGGGSILTGAIRGSAKLRSDGGHIRVASVGGEAHIDTGGGNIFLEHAGARLFANTAGGRILVGEAAGELQAHTGGGGIRVWRLSGPSKVETGAGSIFLAGVNSPVRAVTAAGGITALIDAPAVPATPAVAAAPPAPAVSATRRAARGPRQPRPQQIATLGEFECTGGDLVVFVPKDLGVNIDAAVGGGENFRILVDPSFPLNLTTNEVFSGKLFRAEGAMAGGGPLLRLRATSGNILVRPANLPEAMMAPEAPVSLTPAPAFAPLPPITPGEAAVANLERSVVSMQRQLEMRQAALEAYAAAQERQALRTAISGAWGDQHAATPWVSGAESPGSVEYDGSSAQLAQVDGLREKFAALLTDRVILSAAQLRPRLVHRVDPAYPDAARERGLEGAVRLRVAISKEGSIEDLQVLSGDPILAEAAMNAVRQWRYRPTVLNGKQVPVLTVLTITFHRP